MGRGFVIRDSGFAEALGRAVGLPPFTVRPERSDAVAKSKDGRACRASARSSFDFGAARLRSGRTVGSFGDSLRGKA